MLTANESIHAAGAPSRSPARASRLRLLALGPQDVVPPTDGGKEGIHGALSALASRCDVTYAFPAAIGQVASADYAAIHVEAIAVPHQPRDSVALIAVATLRMQPFKFYKYATPAACDRFHEATAAKPFDAIICFHAHTERLARGILRRRAAGTIPIVVREHNIEYELVASYRAALSPMRRLVASPFEWLTRTEELRIWDRADAVAFLSSRDLATAQATGSTGRLILAPEGVPLPPLRLVRHPQQSPVLLILLNRKAQQSVANLVRFIDIFWAPLYADSRLSNACLEVTGVNATQLSQITGRSKQALSAMRIQALGFVPDLAPVFARALALVSPTFVGGGIRKKMLEAMANQLPVIATQLDIDSCDYFITGDNVLPMNTPAEFLQSVGILQNDATRWEGLSQHARATVEQHASWHLFADVMIGEIQAQLQGRRSAG